MSCVIDINLTLDILEIVEKLDRDIELQYEKILPEDVLANLCNNLQRGSDADLMQRLRCISAGLTLLCEQPAKSTSEENEEIAALHVENDYLRRQLESSTKRMNESTQQIISIGDQMSEITKLIENNNKAFEDKCIEVESLKRELEESRKHVSFYKTKVDRFTDELKQADLDYAEQADRLRIADDDDDGDDGDDDFHFGASYRRTK